MNGGLFTRFLIFCSLWALGLFLKQCSHCDSSISYDDCQSKVSVENCSTANHSCFQSDVQYINSSNSADKQIEFRKGCLATNFCEDYNNGKIGGCIALEQQGYTGSCKARCCDGNNCNNGNLLLESSTTKPTTNKGVAFAISVMVLFFGFLLTFVNFN